jgi:hypothetical protein
MDKIEEKIFAFGGRRPIAIRVLTTSIGVEKAEDIALARAPAITYYHDSVNGKYLEKSAV